MFIFFRIILLLGFLTATTRGHAEMKVYISADMEGVVGVVTGEIDRGAVAPHGPCGIVEVHR